MVRFDQDVLNPLTSRFTSIPVRDMVPWAEVIQGPGSGLSNTKQAAKIQATFNRMGIPIGQRQANAAAELKEMRQEVDDEIAAQEAPQQQEQLKQTNEYPNTVPDSENYSGYSPQGMAMQRLFGGIRDFFGGSPAAKSSVPKAFQPTSNSGTKRIGQ